MSQWGRKDVAPSRTFVVDDDELTRELLSLIVEEAGMRAELFDSGDAVLAHLAKTTLPPRAILCDQQMPGLTGPALARRLRSLCGPQTILLAMSGSTVKADGDPGRGFDAFLLKPFSAQQLAIACERCMAGKSEGPNATDDEAVVLASVNQAPVNQAPVVVAPVVLDPVILAKLSRSMPAHRLAELYQMCLGDARKRMVAMEGAAAASNDKEYRAAAHAIKGGCAMVGAVEVAAIASQIEEGGLSASPDQTPFHRLDVALSHLERMLNEFANES